MLELFRAQIDRKNNENESGFTLIELLVAILIIGILAAVAVPMFLNQRKAAVDSTVESDLKNAATVAETVAIKKPGTVLTTSALLADTKVSDGNALKVLSSDNQGNYCLIAYNQGGADYTSETKPAFYDSMSGGLNRVGGACPASVATPPAEAAGGSDGGGAEAALPVSGGTETTLAATNRENPDLRPQVNLSVSQRDGYVYITATTKDGSVPNATMAAYVNDFKAADGSIHAPYSTYTQFAFWGTNTNTAMFYVGSTGASEITIGGIPTDGNYDSMDPYTGYKLEGSYTFTF